MYLFVGFAGIIPELSVTLFLFNPFALTKAKTPQSFGLSECDRVKTVFW